MQMMKPRKILLIQTASIGDVILFTPVLEKLHAFFPDADIHLLIKSGNEALFKGHPFLSGILIWDKKNNKYGNLLRLIKEIRKEKYDLLVNAQRFASTGLVSVLSGAKTIVGFNKNPFSFLFSKRIKHQINSAAIHEIDRNLALIQFITDSERQMPRLYPTAEDQKSTLVFKQEEYICIAPASLWFTKQFPKEKWVEFIKKIQQNLKIYLLGSAADYELCEQIRIEGENPNCVNLAGKLSLLASAELMRDAKMNYVNDSAPMHLCSAVNAATTAIYCSTVPEFGFGPLANDSKIVEINESLYCRPCGIHGHKACPEGHFKCAYSIEVEQLLNRLK